MLVIFFCKHFKKSDLISQRLLDTGQSWRQQRGLVLKEHQCQQLKGRHRTLIRMTSSIFPVV